MTVKKVLLQAIKEAGLLSQSKVAWVVNPLLEEIAMKFAGYVGPHAVTAQGKNLLQHSLKQAFAKYQQAEDEEQGDSTAMRNFARTLVESSTGVFSQQMTVSTPGGDLIWMPFVCGAIEFLSKFPADAAVTCTWVESRISHNIASAFMMTKILPASLLDQDSLVELLGESKAVS